MPKKPVERPAPRVIPPPRPNMPTYYEWASESEPGRKHRVVVFNGEVKGCSCRGAAHNCWHKQEAAKYESMNQENLTNMTNEENNRAVAVAAPQLPAQAVAVQPRGLSVTKERYDLMWAMAQTAHKAGAGMLPDNIKSPEAALAVMLAGAEFGFEPFTALRLVFIVNGKTGLMAEGLYALMKDRDESLDVEWHERGPTGAEATLYRAGQRPLRIRYDESDKARAHQGQRRAGARKWIPDLDANGKQKVYPAGSKDRNGADRAGKGMVKLNPAFDEDSQTAWEDDESSPWTGYPTDMYSWAVLKRLERFGASDLVNLGPRQRAFNDDDGAPVVLPERSALSKAIVAGEISAAAASDATEPPELAGNPDVPPEEDPEAPQDDVEAADGAWTDIAPDEDPEATPEPSQAQDGPVWASWDAVQLSAQKTKLHDRLVRMKGSMAPGDYGPLVRGMAKDFSPDAGTLDFEVLSPEQVYEGINRTVVAEGGDVGMYWGA